MTERNMSANITTLGGCRGSFVALICRSLSWGSCTSSWSSSSLSSSSLIWWGKDISE